MVEPESEPLVEVEEWGLTSWRTQGEVWVGAVAGTAAGEALVAEEEAEAEVVRWTCDWMTEPEPEPEVEAEGRGLTSWRTWVGEWADAGAAVGEAAPVEEAGAGAETEVERGEHEAERRGLTSWMPQTELEAEFEIATETVSEGAEVPLAEEMIS
jgi:hypothetical protein